MRTKKMNVFSCFLDRISTNQPNEKLFYARERCMQKMTMYRYCRGNKTLQTEDVAC